MIQLMLVNIHSAKKLYFSDLTKFFYDYFQNKST